MCRTIMSWLACDAKWTALKSAHYTVLPFQTQNDFTGLQVRGRIGKHSAPPKFTTNEINVGRHP